MRVAICLSGHMRTVRSCVKSIKKCIIEPNNCEIYVSTWDDWGYTSYKNAITWDQWTSKIKIIPEPDIKITTKELKDLFPEATEIQIEPIQPIIEEISTTIIESIKNKPRSVTYNDSNIALITRFMCMYYKIKKCNELTKKNGPYDMIIRCRPDLEFSQPCKLPIPKPNSIYVPVHNNYGYINDQFAWGNPEILDIYSSIYDKTPRYMHETAPISEGYMLYNLNRNNVVCNRYPINYNLIGVKISDLLLQMYTCVTNYTT
jgi:hypothetical protein